MINSGICERCGKENTYHHMCMLQGPELYPICVDCHNEWFYSGCHKMWFEFHWTNRDELADKFMLDFLGKLG